MVNDYARHKTWDWSSAIPPSAASVDWYIDHLGDCAPGIDGIRNAAWRNGNNTSKKFCHDLLVAHLEGKEEEIPDQLNDGLFVFPS